MERPRARSRVTLDFQGPPLSLPGDGPSVGEEALEVDASRPRSDAPDPGAPGEPDTTQLGRPAARRDGGPGPVPHEAASASEASTATAGGAHDEWTRDRIRRGSDVRRLAAAQGEAAAASAAATQVDGGPPECAPANGAPSSRARRDSVVPGAAEPTDALRLVDRRRRSSPGLDLKGDMADRFALGDFSGALRAAELLLGRDPGDLEARRTAASARERLAHLYTSRLGSTGRVPRVTVPDSEVRWLGLDHRAGFLLSRVDGVHTIEEIIDVSGMMRLEALKLLAELYDADAIRFDR